METERYDALIRNPGYKIVLLATCFHVGFLLGSFFDPEDGTDMFLRNVTIRFLLHILGPVRSYREMQLIKQATAATLD
jgi:hypothetical protein